MAAVDKGTVQHDGVLQPEEYGKGDAVRRESRLRLGEREAGARLMIWEDVQIEQTGGDRGMDSISPLGAVVSKAH